MGLRRKLIDLVAGRPSKKGQDESHISEDLQDERDWQARRSDYESEQGPKRSTSNVDAAEIPPEGPAPAVPGSIIIIIPANRLGSLSEDQRIDKARSINLIDGSIYFRSFKEDEVCEIEKQLDLKEDEILLNTGQDIYVRLDSEDVRNSIEKKSKFSLKKSLNKELRAFRIGKIRLLDKLDGIEKLYRI